MSDSQPSPLDDPRVREFLRLGRVAHLATASTDLIPHNVPLCFWFDDEASFYFVVDEKPKRVAGKGIKRMRNIAANAQVALVVDHYEEDWSALAYVLIHGAASVVEDPGEYLLALRNLRDKYPQYRTMTLTPDRNPIVRIEADRVHAWGQRFATASA
jgi:PPOX class probable F420-dependent enzyme